ncbi:unnamed protein product [Linum tenue]|uniref:Uncharacterized protein n=1 Tax=Linum tenue TaxID=586396 RepID=A0AAV0HA33_9ROSI|nr:unnamed protein product [Linum tenue]
MVDKWRLRSPLLNTTLNSKSGTQTSTNPLTMSPPTQFFTAPNGCSRRSRRHVVAVPYPGRGHINPMLYLCQILSSKSPDLLITVVVTEEWLGLLTADKSIADFAFTDNVIFAAMPNVTPSELVRGSCFPAFYDAVVTKMEAPFDDLLDRIAGPPVTALISDYELNWAIRIGRRRKIPVAMFCTVPGRLYYLFHQFARVEDLSLRDRILDHGDDLEDYSIHGISPPDVADLQAIFRGDDRVIMNQSLECRSWIPKAEFLLVNSVEELEPEVFKALRSKFQSPVYPIGPTIPFLKLNNNNNKFPDTQQASYLQWLDSQPGGSVLYVSLGSSFSISKQQMDEMAAGLRDSDVPFLLVARGERDRLQERCGGGEKGMVVTWCDQLKVLTHGSVAGFWTHCGWNSTLEGVYGGVPMLTFPLIFDQVPNSRLIVEKWRIGWRLKRLGMEDELVTRDEISQVVKRFMDGEQSEVKEVRERAQELGKICRGAIVEGGSSDRNIDDFLEKVLGAKPNSI